MSDENLMRKYGLSENGLKMAFERLLRAMSNGSRQIEIESEESDPDRSRLISRTVAQRKR